MAANDDPKIVFTIPSGYDEQELLNEADYREKLAAQEATSENPTLDIDWLKTTACRFRERALALRLGLVPPPKLTPQEKFLLADRSRPPLQFTVTTPDPPPTPQHSSNFQSVTWMGTTYTFSPNQAACVRVLWENWEKGIIEMSQGDILDAAKANPTRLVDVFRGHNTWRKLILGGKNNGLKKGFYCLAFSRQAAN